ncbi:ribbon-helix-helix domain-containing protein [Azospirillum halopraeferens]|uniref:ribbon-helix-helix domain-containing protein n=1 Tax=Azospirillum halopraeferens TaxID=34010 RepID=UPI0003F8DB35|nr:ribbon-helix-helix domain-containing protein [Azospirillum halopraeferens]
MPLGVEPLRSQNVMIRGHRTSMRLEPSMWDALEEIAQREAIPINELCTRIKDRIDEQARQRGLAPDENDVTLTSAVRVFIAAYFRRASTEDGHVSARHGEGDPFTGTPFDLKKPDDDDAPPSADSGQQSRGGGGLHPPRKGGPGSSARESAADI